MADPVKDRQRRREVWLETRKKLNEIYAEDPGRRARDQSVTKEMLSTKLTIPSAVNRTHFPLIEVTQENCLDMMMRYHSATSKNGSRVLVLNMASPFTPSGVGRGTMPDGNTQEEELFRCTSLSESLREHLYPWKKDAVFYSPEVTVLRRGSQDQWTWLSPQDQFQVSVISAAAPCRPQLTLDQTDWRHAQDREYMTSLVHQIFRVAQSHGHRVLVLGVLGCGNFKNPSLLVSQMFAKEIQFFSRLGCFDRIGFAVFGHSPHDETLRSTFRDSFRHLTEN